LRWKFSVLMAAALAAALASTGAAFADTPTPIPPASPTPVPSPTEPAPLYKGRPCGSGRLVNDFVVLGDREPEPSCIEPFVPEGPAQLYGLSPVPSYLRLSGIEHSVEAGADVVTVVYDALREGPPGSPPLPPARAAVRITFRADDLVQPFPIRLFITSQASAADFLPMPGLLLEPGAAAEIGYWFEAGGLYRLSIESPGPTLGSLEIRHLSGLLKVMTAEEILAPPPGPPATGSGLESRGGGMPPAWAIGAVLGTLTGAVATACIKKRAEGKPQHEVS
jgi:hypothetical protein